MSKLSHADLDAGVEALRKLDTDMKAAEMPTSYVAQVRAVAAALTKQAQPEPSNAKAFDEWFGPGTGEGRFEYGGGCPIRTAAWLAWLAGGDRMVQQAQPEMPICEHEAIDFCEECHAPKYKNQ